MTQTDARELMAEAMAASQRGDSSAAVSQLQYLAQLPGVGGEPLYLLGAEWASLGRMHEAEGAFAAAVLASPGLVMARFQLGLLQVSSGRSALGALTWQPLLNLPADEALRHYVEGYMALIGDSFELAKRSFEYGLSLPQSNEALMADIRKTLAAMPMQNAPESPSGEVAGPSSEVDHHHVLVANYSAGHHRH
jgi:hypothetical protein